MDPGRNRSEHIPATAAAPSSHVLHRGGATHCGLSAACWLTGPRLGSLAIGFGMLPCADCEFESPATTVRTLELRGTFAGHAVLAQVGLEPAPSIASDEGGDRLLWIHPDRRG